MTAETTPYCYRHPERESHIRCQRCERPICPDCMNPASVGFQCPGCLQEGNRTTRSPQAPYGGRRSANPALTSQVLIAINVAVWLLVTATGGRASEWLNRFALFPLGQCEVPGGQRYLSGATEQVCTAQGLSWVDGVASGAWWQLVTSVFTHEAVMHIAFNMFALWILGPQLEAAIGRARFLALYLLSGLAGSAAVMAWTARDIPTVGASGAIFGLMGALLVIAVKVRADYSQILLWLGLNVAITVFGRGFISWQGHFGGLVGGVLIALVIAYSPRPRRTTWQALGLSVLTAAIALVIVLRTAALTL